MTPREQASGLIKADVEQLLGRTEDDLQSRWPDCAIEVVEMKPSGRSLKDGSGYRQVTMMVAVTLPEGVNEWPEVAE